MHASGPHGPGPAEPQRGSSVRATPVDVPRRTAEPPASLLALQRTAGNTAVGGMLAARYADGPGGGHPRQRAGGRAAGSAAAVQRMGLVASTLRPRLTPENVTRKLTKYRNQPDIDPQLRRLIDDLLPHVSKVVALEGAGATRTSRRNHRPDGNEAPAQGGFTVEPGAGKPSIPHRPIRPRAEGGPARDTHP